ncbi:MAG: hypothetical protein ACRYGR_10235 [Janthinobacterium lividum]
MKNFILLLVFIFCLNACVDSPENNLQENRSNPQSLSPYILWQTFEGSASIKGLSHSTILHVATLAQNLFATGQIGQKIMWTYAGDSGEIAIIDILQRTTVPCLQYGQKITTSQEMRRSQGLACVDQFNIWYIVEENPIDRPPHMF